MSDDFIDRTERGARATVAAQLVDAGWTLGGAGRDGVALPEARVGDGALADFLLYVDGTPVGGIETKNARETLGNAGWNDVLRAVASPALPFHYLATGDETLFLSLRDPAPQPRAVWSFHRPETLKRWLAESPFRHRLRQLPQASVESVELASHQLAAVEAIEAALAGNRPRTLLSMPTGTGKTHVVVTEIGRLLEHAGAGRILYLADHREIAAQLAARLNAHSPGTVTSPGGSRAVFFEGEDMPPGAQVLVATVQRLSGTLADGDSRPAYRPGLPPEAFDVIFVDDADRIARSASWILDYFDAFIVGVTSTPSAAAYRYFQGNAVSVDADAFVPPVERAPDVVSQFIEAALGSRHVRRAIDPWVGWGGVLHELTAAAQIDESVAIAPSPVGLPLNESRDDIEWLFGDPLEVLRRTEGEFDLVVGTPPFTNRSRRDQIHSGGESIEVSDAAENLVMLEACSRLSANGEAYFLVPNSFFWKAGKTAWREMHKLGLYPSAVIGMPMLSNVPAPSTIATSTVIVSRTPHDSLFVGQITGEEEYDIKTLVANLRARAPGEVRELGRLVDRWTFTGVHRALDEDRVSAWAKGAGLRPVTLGEISSQINFLSTRRDVGFEEAPNSVYVALIGAPKTGAATNQSDLGAKPSSCFQLVLDPEIAVADYVAAFLNSERGRGLRASWSVGTLPRIQRPGIENKVIYLPPRDRQLDAATLMSTVRAFRGRLTEIEASLADGTADLIEVRGELAALHDENAWIEGLPFPLASILWKHASELDPRDQIEHLLHFFEALSVFAATVLLSGFATDASFFNDHRTDWFKSVQGLKSARWGTWTTLHGRMAHTAREMLEDEARRAQCLELFKATRTSVLEAFSAPEFAAIINEAREFRNTHDAHGPYNDERERRRMVDVLAALLQRFHEHGGRAFRGFAMLRPQDSRYRDGAHYYNAHSLMGSRREFRTIPVTTTAPMEEGRIYLLDLETTTPLLLMPFVQVRPGPATEEDACYFYSSVKNGSVRLVSYHFGLEADIQVEDSTLIATLEALTSKA